MKKYIIINGKDMFLYRAETIAEARDQAINVCDHSKEVIVREVHNSYKLNN